MPTHADRLLRCVHRIASQPGREPDDSGLLTRFLTDRDPAAFEALVARHGPMVLRVCQRVLGNRHDAEDAFQATFLILARTAASVRPPGALAAWLHGVAYRVASGARAVARRRRREQPTQDLDPPDPRPDPLAELTAREALRILEDEVQRLPRAYRLPVALCCLHGASQEEAARCLGCTPGSVKGRLERGRKRLHQRLAGRGLGLALALAELARGTAAGLAPPLAASIVKAAVSFAAGGHAQGALASAQVLALARSGLIPAALPRMKLGLVLLLAVGTVAAGSALSVYQGPAGEPPEVRPAAPPGQAAQDARPPLASGNPQQARVDRYGDPLPPGALARIGTVRFRDGGAIFALAYSPDGKTLASGTGSSEGVIRLWDATTGKERLLLQPHAGQINSLAFSPDGTKLASIGTGKDPTSDPLYIWDATTGERLRTFRQQSGFSVAFAPDGRRLVACGLGGTARLWDIVSGKEVLQFDCHAKWIWFCAFSPDGKMLATASDDQTIRLWDTVTSEELHRMGDPNLSWSSVAFSPDSKVIAGGSREGTVHLWDAASGRERLKIVGHDKWRRARDCTPDGPNIVAFSPDGKSLVSGHEGVVLDAATGKEICQLQGHHRWLRSLVFAPDGKTLAGEDSFRIRFWDAATGKEVLKDAAHRDPVCDLAFSSDSKTVLTTSWDNSAGLWDVDTGRERFRCGGREKAEMQGNRVAVAPDGTKMAAWLGDVLYSWEPRKPNAVREHTGLGGGDCRRSLAFSPEGRILAASWKYGDKQIRLWAEGADREPRLVQVGKHWSNHLVFSPDGKVLASGNGDGSAALWDVATGKELRTLPGFRARKADSPKGELVSLAVNSLAFSPDSNALALGGSALPSRPDGAIGLWGRATGEDLMPLTASDRGAVALAFSPDGKTLATGHDGGTVRFWETASGKIRRDWQAHPDSVYSLAFSPDGNLFASAGSDTTVLIWSANAEQAERKNLNADALDALWADLAGADAVKAYRSIAALRAAPQQSIPFLKSHLRPVPAVRAERVARLIADLDDERFAVRDKASADLAKLGDLAEPFLRKTLEGKPSLEVRHRIQTILEGLHHALPAEQLREVRGVELLERIGTPSAQTVLSALAEGAAGARLTREAKATLRRLALRQPAGR
jgi:RNA polymerase sigma factor (sigma-70 family)